MKNRLMSVLFVFATAIPAASVNAAEGEQIATVSAIITSWQSGDVDGVMQHLHPDIEWHFAAGNAAPLNGTTAIREWLNGFVKNIAETRWRVTDYASKGDTLFVEGIEDYDTAAGETILIPYAGVFEFRDGLVIGWRDYFDRELGNRQRAGEAVTPWVKALAERPTMIP